MTSKNTISERKTYYNNIIKSALATCKVKGWNAEVENVDEDYQLATIQVSKGFNLQTVTGILSITIAESTVHYSIQPTSFQSYGINDLSKAISTKLQTARLIKPKEEQVKDSPGPLEVLSSILMNFDKVVRQLKRRHEDRQILEVNDEYDVQDLLHAILRAIFNDIRPEEYTPSYAGSSSKMDFLLKNEKAVVETKFASHKIREKEIGEQLIVDIKKYQTHPDCDHLYCLVYDPNGVLRNPGSLENDLSGTHEKMKVRVFVVPQ